jgi:phenylalanyl-tRNA synthetase beta chain
MRAPLSWLRDFAPIEGEPEDLARTLAFLGLVVEGVQIVEPGLAGIVVARVLATRPHPSADRIHLVDVDAGDGEALQICCGAFNMRPGDLVPLATLGTVMPSGMEIGRRKMRGEWSSGMLCSAPELGVGPEGPEPAILLLPAGCATPGTPVTEALGLHGDVVFDLEVSPNRSDCFCMVGVARDLAAAMGLPFGAPEPPHKVDAGVERASVAVDAAAASLCPRFTGTVIANVAAVEVPALVKQRLVLAGMRSISPVVDVSNYVMLELGQPNHPYDIDQLGGRGLVVRRARDDEVIVTLDGAERRLLAEDCVIADGNGVAMGVGGIMGGAAAEISPATTAVLLEAANFDPKAISATGTRLGLGSEARTRFERGVDIELAERAVDRFVELLGPGVLRGETTDVKGALPERPPVRLRTARANLLLGTELSPPEVERLLRPLGFNPVPAAGGDEVAAPGDFDVTVPTWRPDCEREVDLIEEVARLHGYDNITRRLLSRPAEGGGLTPYQKGRRRAREILVGAGASEVWTSSFLSAADLARAGMGAQASWALELENPLDQSQGMLRPSLLPGLLGAARFNRERQAGALSLFEVGNVFRRQRAGEAGEGPLHGVVEWEQLVLLAVGEDVDATYAVRAWQVLAAGLRLENSSLVSLDEGAPTADQAAPPGVLAVAASLHPGRRAAIVMARLGSGDDSVSSGHVSSEAAGLVGEVAPEVAERYGLTGRAAVLVVDMAPLFAAPRRSWEAQPISRYPATDLDLAFVVDQGVPAGVLEATLREAAGALAESVALFDVWRDASLGEGRRSLAFRLRLRAADRTLTDEEVGRVRQRVASAASTAHGAVLRGA